MGKAPGQADDGKCEQQNKWRSGRIHERNEITEWKSRNPFDRRARGCRCRSGCRTGPENETDKDSEYLIAVASGEVETSGDTGEYAASLQSPGRDGDEQCTKEGDGGEDREKGEKERAKEDGGKDDQSSRIGIRESNDQRAKENGGGKDQEGR
ncbi:MAG: hypothetical protein FWD68_16315 [Alphaproteobacteria bacterium]|nr:hypothetical protein [Alphaproteobacteria bacterium]